MKREKMDLQKIFGQKRGLAKTISGKIVGRTANDGLVRMLGFIFFRRN